MKIANLFCISKRMNSEWTKFSSVQWISATCPRVYLGQVAEIHINFVHSEFSQNFVDLKQKFWHSFKNSDVVAEGCWFNCIVTRNITRVQPAKSQVELIFRLSVLCWKSISQSKLHCNRLETSCLPSLDPCNQPFNLKWSPRGQPLSDQLVATTTCS